MRLGLRGKQFLFHPHQQEIQIKNMCKACRVRALGPISTKDIARRKISTKDIARRKICADPRQIDFWRSSNRSETNQACQLACEAIPFLSRQQKENSKNKNMCGSPVAGHLSQVPGHVGQKITVRTMRVPGRIGQTIGVNTYAGH